MRARKSVSLMFSSLVRLIRYGRIAHVRILIIFLLIFSSCASKSGNDELRTSIQNAEGELEAYFLAVGQGDAALVRLPSPRQTADENILIDAGDIDAPTVQKLRELKVKKITIAVASHPHTDHIGQMREVLRSFPVEELWDSGYPHTTRTYLRLLEEVKRRNIKYLQPKAGYTRKLGSTTIEVLHPDPTRPIDDNANNASIVLRITFGKTHLLFTGDAEFPSWEHILRLRRNQVRADVLKAPHHGSSDALNSGILINVRPSYVVISCGLGNPYHHPHASVMKLLKAKSGNIKVLRTDLHGTVRLSSNGESIRVTTERSPEPNLVYLSGDETAKHFGINVTAAAGRSQSDGRGEQTNITKRRYRR